jgi:hypothetical protein
VRALGIAAALLAALVLALLALAGAIGWLYALYRAGLLGLGPRVPDALALEALAGHAGQPLLRFAVAWLSAGVAVGLIARVTPIDARVAVPAFALWSATLLVAVGAVSDALTANQRVAGHIVPQLGAAANLAAWTALVAGALAAQARSRPYDHGYGLFDTGWRSPVAKRS